MKKAGNPAASLSQLDVVFDGTWLIVPTTDTNGCIVSVDVYAPSCGHPQGVTFVPSLDPNPWPTAPSFYMLDSHGVCLDLQFAGGPRPGIPASSIDPKANQIVKKGRPMRGNWDLQVSITAGPDKWATSETFAPQFKDPAGNTLPCITGADAPKGNVSSLQTLSFTNVTVAALCGAPSAVQAQLPSPWKGVGTMIFEGEIPYIPTLQHERQAIFAMANLAGLDMALEHPLPKSAGHGRTGKGIHIMTRTGGYCGYTLIVS